MAPVDNQRRIVLFIRRHGEASLTELSRGLGLTQVTLRRHLDELMRAGVVSPPEKRRRSGPGRPEQEYSLTASAEPLLPENYRDLANAILGVLQSRHGPEWVRELLQEVGASTAPGFGLTGSRSHKDFMPQVLAGLEERGYLPAAGTWSGRRCLTFAHCPYLDAARASPAVCAFDRALIETLLDEPVVHFRRIADHDERCVFLLGV
jgi:DeoR family suf operon transcriptional repressor